MLTDTEIMRRIGEAYRALGLNRTFSREELLGAGKSGTGKEKRNPEQCAQRLQTAVRQLEQSLPLEKVS